MSGPTCRWLASIALALVALGCERRELDPARLGAPDVLGDGVHLYRTGDPALVEHAGPIAVWLVRVDPRRARVRGVLSNDEVLEAETVESMAVRHRAIAAVNGGFFNRDTGEPTGVLKLQGQLVSDASAARGVVVFDPTPLGPPALLFDRLAAKMSIRFESEGRTWQVPIDGLDTTRGRSKLMLYTPAYHPDTDTAPTGTEWVLDGSPLTVTAVRRAGRSAIPAHGAVLSYGGTTLPAALAALTKGTVVTIRTGWKSAFGVPTDVLDRASDIINGAGLLRRGGTAVTDWRPEGLSQESFTGARHPRTIIGVDRRGFIWLGAIDGRQPDYSIGMTFADLERLCASLELTGALNLDGGGSTTLVAKGHVVNRPSDPGGARSVSDAIVVTSQ